MLIIVVNPYRRFRCCSFAATAAAVVVVVAVAVAADRSTTVVAALVIWNSEHENYDELIDREAIDRSFFAVGQQSETRIGVPPLLRTESATLCLWDRP